MMGNRINPHKGHILEVIPLSYFEIWHRVLTRVLRTLSETRRERQGERQKTKGLMSRTKAVHMRDKSLNISKPASLCITTT